jgi:sulfhydrogenase subunit beta (sulfur reductase)
MSEIYLSKDALAVVIQQWIADYRVLAPVDVGQYHEFKEVKRVADIDLGYRNTRLSPKELMEPQSERMFDYSLAKDDPKPEFSKRPPKTSLRAW